MMKFKKLFKKEPDKVDLKKVRRIRKRLRLGKSTNSKGIMKQAFLDSDDLESNRLSLIKEDGKKMEKLRKLKKKRNNK